MDFLSALGIQETNYGAASGQQWLETSGSELSIHSPATGAFIAKVRQASEEDYETIIARAQEAFPAWRDMPAPGRGEIVRQIGLRLRAYKEPLGKLVSYEMGKSLQEGLGEVQEMIDICDFAVGLSRQLYGFTMHSERPQHRMYDQYHPLGIVLTISAFNFPVAVWSWNAMIAAVCGDVNLWKPSSKVPLTAIACQNIVAEVLRENDLPEGLFSLVIGKGATIGERMLADKRIPLVSVTGSINVGRHANEVVSRRFGRCILELGGNNAIILTPDAKLKTAIPAVVFGAVGTAGQRCTTTRRLIVHASIYDQVREALVNAYGSLRIGTPMDESNHVGPLIDRAAVAMFGKAIEMAQKEGGRLIYGGEI
ncbi:MAG: aldehyde dehydrogenase family protein, partial [Bacteroidota bacterium]|nr:aldehyde dehydrogenase family protein [Bacteroidota bacterium]